MSTKPCRCGSEFFAVIAAPDGAPHRGELVCYECGQHAKWPSLADLSAWPTATDAQAARLRLSRQAPSVSIDQLELL